MSDMPMSHKVKVAGIEIPGSRITYRMVQAAGMDVTIGSKRQNLGAIGSNPIYLLTTLIVSDTIGVMNDIAENDHGALRRDIQQSRPFSNLETEVFLNLLRTSSFLQGEQEQLLRKNGLTVTLYNVLRVLRGSPEGLTCSTIRQRMVSRVPDTTRLVDRLIARGLAARGRGAKDRRQVIVMITDKGLELLAELDEPIESHNQGMLGHMPLSDLTELNRLLVRARSRIAGSE